MVQRGQPFSLWCFTLQSSIRIEGNNFGVGKTGRASDQCAALLSAKGKQGMGLHNRNYTSTIYPGSLEPALLLVLFY
jgi:hypothetical protein